MNTSSFARPAARLGIAQALVAAIGLLDVLAALGLLLAPAWFLANVGPFPPFNRHYMGDAGAFLLPLGVGLMIAARDLARHRLLVQLGAVASLLHVLNHLYDDLFVRASLVHMLTDAGPLLIIAIVLLLVGRGRYRGPE